MRRKKDFVKLMHEAVDESFQDLARQIANSLDSDALLKKALTKIDELEKEVKALRKQKGKAQ